MTEKRFAKLIMWAIFFMIAVLGCEKPNCWKCHNEVIDTFDSCVVGYYKLDTIFCDFTERDIDNWLKTHKGEKKMSTCDKWKRVYTAECYLIETNE